MATDENKITKAEWHGFLFLPPEGMPILSSNGFKVSNNQASTKRREPNLRLRVPYPGNLSEIQFVHTGCVGSVSQNQSKQQKNWVTLNAILDKNNNNQWEIDNNATRAFNEMEY